MDIHLKTRFNHSRHLPHLLSWILIWDLPLIPSHHEHKQTKSLVSKYVYTTTRNVCLSSLHTYTSKDFSCHWHFPTLPFFSQPNPLRLLLCHFTEATIVKDAVLFKLSNPWITSNFDLISHTHVVIFCCLLPPSLISLLSWFLLVSSCFAQSLCGVLTLFSPILTVTMHQQLFSQVPLTLMVPLQLICCPLTNI